MKPGKGQFQIDFRSSEQYEPDFVVEAKDRVFICEVKAGDQMSATDVTAKANAATKWCKAATEHATKNKGKPWTYVLIPDDQIIANATLDGLVSRFAKA